MPGAGWHIRHCAGHSEEGNTLPQTDEADHDGNHDRQQTQNFIQNTAHHLSGNNTGKTGGSVRQNIVKSPFKRKYERIYNKSSKGKRQLRTGQSRKEHEPRLE